MESFWIGDGAILTELTVGEQSLRLGLDEILDFFEGGNAGGGSETLASEGCRGGGKGQRVGERRALNELGKHSRSEAVSGAGGVDLIIGSKWGVVGCGLVGAAKNESVFSVGEDAEAGGGAMGFFDESEVSLEIAFGAESIGG